MKITDKSRLQIRINSFTMMLLIISLAGLLSWVSTRYSWQMDMTQSGRHTLSDASKEVLTRMDGPVEITAYAREDVNLRNAIKKVVSRYQSVKEDIVLRFVNPDAVPDEVRNLGIRVNGELIFRYKDHVEHVRSNNEEELTNAMQRLARGSQHWLAFVEGHGERNSLGKANHDLGEWVRQLGDRGFRIQPLNLANIQSIPDNTRVLVIAGPQVAYLPGETELILNYINAGGNLLWLIDPGDLHGLEPVAEEFYMNVLPGTIIDLAGRLIGIDDPTIVLLTASMYPLHPVTKDFTFTAIFPTASMLQIDENDTWQIKPLLSTGEHAWLERDKVEGEVGYDEGRDQLGPLDIGISLERETEIEDGEELVNKQQRIVLIGDGDFISNTYIENSGNLDLGIRIINWLSNEDDFISIPARTVMDANLELSTFSSAVIGFGFLIILPLILLGTGITIWLRRKKL